MSFYESSHRRVNPGRESVGSDLYTVLRYNPEFQTCDLAPASINQRGILTQVPISQPFGGAWELQTNHEPSLEPTVNPEQWGNCPRGPRWGMSLPIQPGDMARVMYVGESMSDPVITQFYRWRGDYGVPWAANQILSQPNDYTNETADDDDLLSDRWDVMLPSGAWMRSTAAGSWVIATAPVDRARAFLTLHADGKIRIKSRNESDYTIHLDFDPNKQEGRIAVGPLQSASYIEFKGGDITLKANGKIQMLGQRIEGDARPAGSGALNAIITQPSSMISDQALPGLVASAAGEMALQSFGGGIFASTATSGLFAAAGNTVLFPDISTIASSFLSNPAIDGALRGRIGDLLVEPSQLIDRVLGGITGGLANDQAIGQRLGQLIGLDALTNITGKLENITSRVDITTLPMVRELGIPSWVGQGIQEAIASGSPIPALLNVAASQSDNELLAEVARYAGAIALNGSRAPSAREALDFALDELEDGNLSDRIRELIPLIDQIPMRSPEAWVNVAAQRLGAHVLRGNNMLGGAADLFDLDILEDLDLGELELGRFRRVANQIEDFFANPHQIPERIPELIAEHLPQIAQIPPEIRSAIASLPSQFIPQIPELLSDVLGGGSGEEHPFHEDKLWDLVQEPLASLLGQIPEEIQGLLQNLPQEVFGELANILPNELGAILDNPQGLLSGLDSGLVNSLFGGMTSGGSGTFDMRVLRRATFRPMPETAQPLTASSGSEFHEQTVATEIERPSEYGVLNLPNFWSTGDGL